MRSRPERDSRHTARKFPFSLCCFAGDLGNSKYLVSHPHILLLSFCYAGWRDLSSRRNQQLHIRCWTRLSTVTRATTTTLQDVSMSDFWTMKLLAWPAALSSRTTWCLEADTSSLTSHPSSSNFTSKDLTSLLTHLDSTNSNSSHHSSHSSSNTTERTSTNHVPLSNNSLLSTSNSRAEDTTFRHLHQAHPHTLMRGVSLIGAH